MNVQDADGTTPLMLCCAEDTDHEQEARCVEYLLSHNADIVMKDKKVKRFHICYLQIVHAVYLS